MSLGVIIFTFGLIIGSFLNVVIYRLPKKEPIVFSRSYCPSCETKLQPIDLIPVLSFILTKSSCRYCGRKISYQYPIVELVTGLLFFTLYKQYYFTIEFFLYVWLISLLIVASFIDFKYQIIPNQLTYLGIVSGLGSSLLTGQLNFKSSLSGIVIPAIFLLLIIFITKGGMGLGDVKLIAMVGSFIGGLYSLVAIFIGAFIGSIIALFLLSSGAKEWGSRLPFGPFIALGSLIMILWGNQIINWYLRLFLY
ncbi:A24 family peptidase [Halanaerocella petrolearia]